MVWIQFIGAALIVIFAAIKLAEYGDGIAYHTKLGGLFIGSLLIATATSLPELLTMISAIGQGHINLTAGDLFGSSMFNMLLLAILDLIFYKTRILRRVALKHALTASLATLLTGMAVFFIIADLPFRIGWIGLDSIAIMVLYIIGVRLIRDNPVTGRDPLPEPETEPENGHPSLKGSIIGFLAAAVVLIFITPIMVRAGAGIAEITGLGDGFVGVVLIALVTSLPETVAMITAARIGAFDMAVGNLFGSNMFNMFALAAADLVYTQGTFFAAVDSTFALVGMLAALMTTLALIGNLAHVEKRIWIIELDALLLLLVYAGGIILLFTRGVGG